MVWIEPPTGSTANWTGFQASSVRHNGRRRAQCTHCKSEIDGKTSKLCNHMTQACKSISIADRSAYNELNLNLPAQNSPNNNSQTQNPSTSDGSSTLTLAKRKKLVHDFSSLHHLKTRDKKENMKTYEDLLKALITGDVPFRFLHNKSFRDFQQKLSLSPYTPASRHVMMDMVIPRLHAQYSILTKSELKKHTNMKISLDGWTDCSRNSVYAVLLLRGTEIKKMIDVLDLDDVRHTSENTFCALKKALGGQEVTWEQIGGIVTDSPASMVKLRVGFIYDYSSQLFHPSTDMRALYHNLQSRDLSKPTLLM